MKIKQVPLNPVKPLKTAVPKVSSTPRRKGQTNLLKSIEPGASVRVKAERVSTPRSLHTLATRGGMKIAVRRLTGKHEGKLEIHRLK